MQQTLQLTDSHDTVQRRAGAPADGRNVCNGTCCRRRLDDAACSRDVEEVVAAGLQTCSANVCMTHVRTAARSLAHRDQLSNASAAHFVREDEDPCKMTYSRMALIERDLSATTQMQMHS